MKKNVLAAVILAAFSFCHAELSELPFCNKLIFTETPEIGTQWHGGIRITDVVIWEGYFNIYNWMLVDFVHAGFSGLNIKGEDGGEDVTLKDYFWALTLKSRPFGMGLKGGDYKAAAGLKIYEAPFNFKTETDSMPMNDGSTVIFLAQSYLFKLKHQFNLFTSLSFRGRKDSHGDEVTTTTYYIVPGYRVPFSKHWSFAIEYFMTNTERLPLKILQFAFDEDKLDFMNSGRDMYSWMFYGCHYTRKHLRVDLNMANHITFQGLVLPMIGVGWNF